MRRRNKRRALAQQVGPRLSEVFRRGEQLASRQLEWNALVSLEAQDRTWLLDWRHGQLEVLCQSGVWLAWLRRTEKTLIKRWNQRYPEAPVQRVIGSIAFWTPRPISPLPDRRPPLQGPAPKALRELAKNSEGPLQQALQRLVQTLDDAADQAGAATKVSTKVNGARSSDG